MKTTNSIKKKEVDSRMRSRLIFYIIMLIWPVLQNTIFYIFVNFNSFILAFQKYDYVQVPGTLEVMQQVTFAGFSNFSVAWSELLVRNSYMIANSLKFFALDFPIQLTLALAFSFYIYKKYPAAGAFKVCLFLPQIISGLVFCAIFKYIVADGYMQVVTLINYGGNHGMTVEQLLKKLAEDGLYTGSLLQKTNSVFGIVAFYNIWFSFGVNILMYSSAMSGIDESVVESAQLDGCNVFQEFWHISVPLIYPTLVSLVIVSIAGLFTNQVSLVSLYGTNLPTELKRKVGTLGFELYCKTSLVGNVQNANNFNEHHPGVLSAWGLIVSAVMVPVSLTARKLLVKLGPSVD